MVEDKLIYTTSISEGVNCRLQDAGSGLQDAGAGNTYNYRSFMHSGKVKKIKKFFLYVLVENGIKVE